MGSSAKKKRDKKRDFQKPKLRVGKQKAKPDNFTDTSFKSKSIVINQQSLTTSAPSSTSQFNHYLSLASSSKSESQRRDALAYLTSQVALQPVRDFASPTAVILPKLLPLVLDGSNTVRSQLLKFFRLLPSTEVGVFTEFALLYIRAGMTHLAPEIRNDALAVLEWLLEIAKDDVVTCPGGWVKTLRSFMSMMGWVSSGGMTNWTAASKVSFGKSGKAFPKQMLVLAQFLTAGLVNSQVEQVEPANRSGFPLWDVEKHMVPTRPSAFAHLNLFGSSRDEDGEMYIDQEERLRVFQKLFQPAIDAGVQNALKDGGEAGRAAAVLKKALSEGLGKP